MTPFIKANHVSFYYEGNESSPAIHDISLNIEEGEYIAILGHNGSGKSTFAKLCNAILLPSSGEMVVNGVRVHSDMTDDDVFEIRKNVGMVFQNPDNQIVATIVEEDVAFGPENLGVPQQEIVTRVKEALEIVGMTEYAKHSPTHLSGGQKQRVALAGIIAMKPTCIIFDESTSMLDPRGRKDILACMEKLNREEKITIIHITHYMEEAMLANRIVVFDNGALLLDGKPLDVFQKMDTLKECGLDVPQGMELVSRLQKDGFQDCHFALRVEDVAKEILANIKKED